MNSNYDLAMGIPKLIIPRKVEEHLSSNKWLIKQEAIKRLGEIGDDKSIKKLIKVLKISKDKYDLIYTISSLGKLKAKSAVPVLLKYIDSKNSEVANSSIYALGEIGDKSAIPYLEKKMSVLRLRNYCEDALKKLNKDYLLKDKRELYEKYGIK